MTKLAISYIGSIAQQSFANKQTASVVGNTSRGIFLKTAPKWVVFLSYKDFRGPLTLNLVGDVSPLRVLPSGGMVYASLEEIAIPGAGISIGLGNARPWGMQPLRGQPLSRDERVRHLLSFIQQAHARAKGAGLSGLLPSLGEDADHAGNHPQQADLLHLRKNLAGGAIPTFIQALNKLLGRGGGLTPSWDDFTMGLLLTLNRWRHAIPPQIDLDDLNTEIAKSAYTKTTTISANLIECAARGLADERLVTAVDYLMAGVGERSQVLEHLLGWGNSSGVDALLGMAVAILSHHHAS